MSETLTKLQPGHIVMLDGCRHRIVMVNDCRARAVPCDKVQSTIEQIVDGKKVVVASFSKYGVGQNISPNSEIPIVGYEKPEPIITLPGSESGPSLPRRGRGRPRKSVAGIEPISKVQHPVGSMVSRLVRRK
jgi:hypothetical protein